MELDHSAQRLLIMALKTQIDTWKTLSKTGTLTEEDMADVQNDIGYAYALLSEIESGFYKEFEADVEQS